MDASGLSPESTLDLQGREATPALSLGGNVTKSCLLALIGASLLLSCSTAPKIDPLEAKARNGDPVAACQLAARSLHDCALELQSWEKSKAGPRPACVAEGINDQQRAYLDKAGDKLRPTDQILFLSGPRVQLVIAYVSLVIAPADKAVQAAVEAQQSCSEFADSMVD